MKAYLVRVLPERQSVVGISSNITPQIMQRLLRAKVLVQAQVGVIEGKPVHYTRAQRTVQEDALLPRWQLGDGNAIAGPAVLFGLNSAGRAASCPARAQELLEHITWLGPLGGLGAVLR
jgi:hypothetical protein